MSTVKRCVLCRAIVIDEAGEVLLRTIRARAPGKAHVCLFCIAESAHLVLTSVADTEICPLLPQETRA